MHKFNTNNKNRAIAALCVYAVYRSRNQDRFKISTKMWDQISNFTKLSAKKSTDCAKFLDQFSKRMKCDSINPKFLDIGQPKTAQVTLENGGIIEREDEEKRVFINDIIEKCNNTEVINTLINETAFVIMLVRERLEDEKLMKGLENE